MTTQSPSKGDDIDPQIRAFVERACTDFRALAGPDPLTMDRMREISEQARKAWTLGGPDMAQTLMVRVGAGDFIRFENLIAPGGKLPINTSGGNIGQGFIHGIGMMVECIHQLRGESSNPVPGAKTCLLAGGPGAPIVSSAIFGTDRPD